MATKMSCVLVVGAPSGTGKTTLLRRLMARHPGIRFSVSHTTRPMRAGEEDGVDYRYVTREAFDRSIEEGQFLEWAEVYGHRYGTHRSAIEQASRAGADLLVDVDPQGARALRSGLPDAVFVLIVPPSWEVLERRLRSRGTDAEEIIRRRLALARRQIEAHADYDYLVVNDDLETAVDELDAIRVATRQRLGQQMGVVAALMESRGDDDGR